MYLASFSGAALETARAIRLGLGDPEHMLAKIDRMHTMLEEVRDVARQRAEGASR